ncbi:MAG TPA: sulfite exporter TauE/SafE family protein [Pirellulales bacterium]|jgi:hypothetical protein|nr:sulfite exporter TauE/SafE family protein [Pirellulales bacterium]
MFETYLWLCLSAIAAGAINAVAGGGTLLTFPALFAALGTSAGASVMANATSTVALVPASLAAIWGYRREFIAIRRWALMLAAPSLVGGFIGSALVIARPESFKMAVPWLILTAALLFAVQPVVAHLTGIGRPRVHITWRGMLGAAVLQFLISIYGGYFGAGIGILMLTSLAVMGLSDIHEMNALKSVLGTIINATSVVVFVANGTVDWPFAGAMALASIVGGYAGAHLSRRMNRRLVRWIVVGIGLTLASYYFWRQAH